jgi:uncharacterized membrane protein YwzB
LPVVSSLSVFVLISLAIGYLLSFFLLQRFNF